MIYQLHHLVEQSAWQENTALIDGERSLNYQQLSHQSQLVAANLAAKGIKRGDRVALFLPKQIEMVVTLLAISRLGAIFIPLNPVLKPPQVQHILQNSGACLLITSQLRQQGLQPVLEPLSLQVLIFADHPTAGVDNNWQQLLKPHALLPPCMGIDQDPAAILYTSGSTGQPKGVVLSHGNLLAGAFSVSSYLNNTAQDRILSVLPLSFDAGLSQLTTAFAVGAQVVLLNYLLPRDVIQAVQRWQITGLTGVPPLWIQLAKQDWGGASSSLRYFANTGGHLPRPIVQQLRGHFAKAKPYLMYGLTEAFRSTYLPPELIDQKPDSMGKAIPNAEILVINCQGKLCQADEPGELVHRGALVSLGYWQDSERTKQRFRPLPEGLGNKNELAVWSGDTVRRDQDGYLYFIGRDDEMIKTSGYRVSPNEIETVLYQHPDVRECVVLGIADPQQGHAILAVINGDYDATDLRRYCQRQLANYMIPRHLWRQSTLPRNPNGKFDRVALRQQWNAQ